MKKIFLLIGLIVILFFSASQVLAVTTTGCTDTDSGQNLSVKGTVNYVYNGQNKSAMDYCPDSSKLVEYYCTSGSAYGVTKSCANGCINGACNSTTTTCTPNWQDSSWSACTNGTQSKTFTDLNSCANTAQKQPENRSCNMSATCSETDDGLDPWKYGALTDSSRRINLDYCVTPTVLGEYHCRTEDASSFEQITCKYGCFAGACKTGCTDSDGGINYNQKGTAVLDITDFSIVTQNKYFEDSCTGNTLKEYSCQDGLAIFENKICPNGCEAGACKQSTTTSNTCVDTDGGRNYNTLGIVTDPTGTGTDICPNSGRLSEFYCNGIYKAFEQVDCAYGCENGACRTAPVVCTPNYSNCTAWSACTGGQKTQTCTQTNCASLPPTKTNTESCTPGTTTCSPVWICGEFAACAGGQKAQICTQNNCPLQDRTKMNTQSCTVPTITCTDPDGHDYSKKETLTYAGRSFTDYCDARYPKNVLEYYCNSAGEGKAEWGSCPNGCEAGACKTTTTPTTCTPNYGNCTAWSTCTGGQKTQTCTQSNCPLLALSKTETQSCTTSSPNPVTCTDSDSGKEYFTKGFTVNSSGQRSEDVCSGNELTEYYCKTDGSGESMFEFRKCDYGIGAYKCLDGACVALSQPCSDSDGKEYFTKGTAIYNGISYTDRCDSRYPTYVLEYYCDSRGLVNSEWGLCANKCSDGSCKSATGTTLPVVDVKINNLDGLVTLTVGSTATLSWTSQNATSCGGSQDALSGSQTITVVLGQKTYTAVCANSNGNSTATVTVIGTATPPTTSGVCDDSDGGMEHFIGGLTKDKDNKVYTDNCVGNKLVEYYCSYDGSVLSKDFYCAYGCNNNACKPSYSGCAKSDGEDFFKKSTIYISTDHDGGKAFIDSCIDSNYLKEYYCDESGQNPFAKYSYRNFKCDYGCVDGVCNKSIVIRSPLDVDSAKMTMNRSYSVNITTAGYEGKNLIVKLLKYEGFDNGITTPRVIESKDIGTITNLRSNNSFSWTPDQSIQITDPYGIRYYKIALVDASETETIYAYSKFFFVVGTITCTDSDGDIDYYKKGTATDSSGGSGTDSCSGNRLTEYKCTSDGVRSENHVCVNSCVGGACVDIYSSSQPGCNDSDEGIKYDKKGTVTANENIMSYDNQGRIVTDIKNTIRTDYCDSNDVLIEYYCGTDGKVRIDRHLCDNRCDVMNGICGIDENDKKCSDSDGGKSYYTPGYVTIYGASNLSHNDFCAGNYLAEQYCDSTGNKNYVAVLCPLGCSGFPGKCISSDPPSYGE